MPITSWSTTAADNDDSDSASGITWPEGMNPAQVNNSARAMMAVIKGDLANSLTGSGYQKLPNGLVIQWGLASLSADQYVTFPIPFPTALFNIVTSVNVIPTATQLYATNWDSGTVIGFNARTRYVSDGGAVTSVGSTISWMAIGY